MRLIECGGALALLTGCASPGMPPGGPPDTDAPRLVGIAPDSGRVGISPRNVIFRFDEVVSERPASVTTLADLFLVSPQHGTPIVEWRREEIRVRPRRGWRPNTVYSVQMLPGLGDLRGNVRREGAATLFATGSAIPATHVTGRVFDWAEGRPAPRALVQAMAPDSTTYLAYADTAGAYAIAHLPPGTYQLTGVIDGNRNRALDPREPWDTATVTLLDSAHADLFVFVHDSVGPRVASVVASDSVTLRVSFNLPVDARQPVDPRWITVRGADSIALPIASVSPGVAVRDTATAAVPADTMPSRPQPYRELTIVMATPLQPGATYTVTASGVPGLLGRVSPSSGTVTVPAPPPPTAPAEPPQPPPQP